MAPLGAEAVIFPFSRREKGPGDEGIHPRPLMAQGRTGSSSPLEEFLSKMGCLRAQSAHKQPIFDTFPQFFVQASFTCSVCWRMR
jgi:hypothetical protein